MSERLPPVKMDLSVSLPMIAALLIAVGSASAFLSSKLDSLADVVERTANNDRRITSLEREILLNRAETLKNREVSKQILEEVK